MDGDFDRLAAATIPELPSTGQRWTVRRKAAVIEALRGGWVPVEEICRLYDLSADENVAWERDIDRYGVHGLRTTRLQIYRDTDNARRDGATLGRCGPATCAKDGLGIAATSMLPDADNREYSKITP